MESAEALFKESGGQREDARSATASLRDRRKFAKALLTEYGRTRYHSGLGAGCEYLWIDEFCLSDHALGTTEQKVKPQRSRELGRLADIYRGASRVCVFCHIPNCDHTRSSCPWGKRLFTLPEIIPAADVLVMMRRKKDSKTGASTGTLFKPMKAGLFREKIQIQAAKDKRWHVYTLMQHANNEAAVSWQNAIHALLVEAMLRNEAEASANLKAFGKCLNGLLPRRARLEDLKGEDGWEDLSWLLELNQAFFNVTSLAAVSSTAELDVQNHRWLGKPITPKEGHERLESVVTSFPVRVQTEDGMTESALYFASPRTIPLHHWMQRDSWALFNRKE
ncbi:hypothetical protein M422DRAFT_232236, partial [Sphaerobolus stellatus SS14]